jgi:hypothetical protein
VSPPDSEPKQPEDERVVALHRATIAAVDFRRARFDRFSLGGCLFDRCDFRGLKLLDPRLAALLVALPRSVFRDSRFDGCDMRRARLGQSRFERCTFDDARIDGCHAEAAEFVGCRFAGPLDAVTFHGAPPAAELKRMDPPRRRNEFHGNDFRDADLIDVSFVAGIEMDRQRFPDDELHVRVERFQRRLARARTEIAQWYERERAPAVAMLATLAERWRDQDVVVARRWTPRIKASDRVQARVWELLEHI